MLEHYVNGKSHVVEISMASVKCSPPCEKTDYYAIA